MFPAFLLALREGLEAALVVGLILGTLARLRLAGLRRAVWSGVAGAAAVSLAVAGGLYAVGRALEGPAEPIFEGATMLLAAAVLTWMLFWMHQHAPHLRRQIETDVERASLLRAAGRGLFALAFFAVVREGVELALFLTALVFQAGRQPVLAGALLGLVAAVGLGWAVYSSSLRLNLRLFFRVTTVLLLVFAAGLVAHGVHEFVEVGWLPPLVDPIWNTNGLLPEQSIPGQFLKALFGYNGDPTLMEVGAYLAYVASIVAFLRRPTWRTTTEPAS